LSVDRNDFIYDLFIYLIDDSTGIILNYDQIQIVIYFIQIVRNIEMEVIQYELIFIIK